MRQWHKLAKRTRIWLVIWLSLIVLVGGVFAKITYDRYQLQQKVNRTLKLNGYPDLMARRRVYKEETGPFSGLIWYEYTFSNKQSLQAGYQYRHDQGKPDKQLTLQNSPIVYRIVLIPPGTKLKEWQAYIYLDTNEALRDSTRSKYVTHLNKTSLQPLKLQAADRH